MNESLPNQTTSAISAEKHNLLMGLSFVPRLANPAWWRLFIHCVLAFQPYLLKPAIMLGLGLTVPYVGLDLALRSLNQHNGRAYNGLLDIILSFGLPIIIIGAASLGSLAVVLWALAKSLLALTAMCRTFLTIAPDVLPADKNAFAELVNQTREDAIRYFRERKSFLVTVWLMYSVFMLVPSILLLVSGSIVMTGMPRIGDYTALPIQLNLPSELLIASAITLGITVLIMSNYALILLPFSSVCEDRGTRVAIKGLVLSFKTLVGLTAYSFLTFTLSSLLCSPIDLLVVYNQTLANNDWTRYLLFGLKAFWHFLFFAFLVPITVLLPCEIIRGNID